MNVVLVNPIGATANLTAGSVLRPRVPSVGSDAQALQQSKPVALASELASRGHRLTVVVADVFLKGQDWAFPNGVRVVPVSTVMRVPFHPGLIPATPALLRHPALQESDVIQVSEFHQPSTYFAAIASQALSVPVVGWQETFRRMRFPGSVYQRVYESTVGPYVRAHVRRFLPRTTKARAYLRELRLAEGAIGPWVPTGIDADAYAPRTCRLSPQDFGCFEADRILLLVARLHPTKGIDLALRALKRLLHKHPNARLVVRGGGPERAALQVLARDLGVEASVTFLEERSQEDMIELYNLADVVLNTSRVDLSPFSLMEASACGRACVATDVGAIRDIVVDDETGILVREPEAESIAEAVSALLADDERRLALGRAARVRAERHFALPVVADQLLEVYRDVAS